MLTCLSLFSALLYCATTKNVHKIKTLKIFGETRLFPELRCWIMAGKVFMLNIMLSRWSWAVTIWIRHVITSQFYPVRHLCDVWTEFLADGQTCVLWDQSDLNLWTPNSDQFIFESLSGCLCQIWRHFLKVFLRYVTHVNRMDRQSTWNIMPQATAIAVTEA